MGYKVIDLMMVGMAMFLNKKIVRFIEKNSDAPANYIKWLIQKRFDRNCNTKTIKKYMIKDADK
jgi:hypothetical protein